MTDSVERIEDSAFECLEYIGEDAFRFCVSLISIFIPTSCQEIDDFAFDRCYKLILLCDPQHTEVGYKVIDHTVLAKVNTRFNNGVNDDEWIKDINQAEEFALHQAFFLQPAGRNHPCNR